LWFDNNAEEAMKFYTSIFKNSKIGRVTRYSEGAPVPAGTFMTGTFRIEGQEFGVEWRPDLQIYRGDIVCGEL